MQLRLQRLRLELTGNVAGTVVRNPQVYKWLEAKDQTPEN